MSFLQDGPYYSPGPITSDLLDAGSVQNFLDDVRTALENSGWIKTSNVSGSGGTTGYVMRSRKPEFGARIKTQFWWNGGGFGGPLILFTVMNDAETISAVCGRVQIESQKVQRIICGPYQYFIFFDLSVSPVNTTQGLFRNDASCGIPVLTEDLACFWGLGQLNSWRHHLAPTRSNANDAEMVFYQDGILYDSPASSSSLVYPQLSTMRGSSLLQSVPFTDDYYPIITPILSMGLTSAIKCYSIWDAFVHGVVQTTKRAADADYHNWESFTIQPFDGGVEVGCLWLVTGSESSQRVASYSH